MGFLGWCLLSHVQGARRRRACTFTCAVSYRHRCCSLTALLICMPTRPQTHHDRHISSLYHCSIHQFYMLKTAGVLLSVHCSAYALQWNWTHDLHCEVLCALLGMVSCMFHKGCSQHGRCSPSCFSLLLSWISLMVATKSNPHVLML